VEYPFKVKMALKDVILLEFNKIYIRINHELVHSMSRRVRTVVMEYLCTTIVHILTHLYGRNVTETDILEFHCSCIVSVVLTVSVLFFLSLLRVGPEGNEVLLTLRPKKRSRLNFPEFLWRHSSLCHFDCSRLLCS